MSFWDKVRYRLGRWAARDEAYASSSRHDAWTTIATTRTGSLIGKEAGDDVISAPDDPGDQEREEFGTEL